MLKPARQRAAAHPGGLVDLSIGTPVDPVPAVVREALAHGADWPGYPPTAGTPQLRAVLLAYVSRHCGADLPESGVLPTIGSKELVASLPALLGLGPDDAVVMPSVCYPTYEVGARLVGARVIRSDAVWALAPDDPDLVACRVGLVWVNSPGNPHGRVLTGGDLARTVAWAREHGAVVASDECYLELGWESDPVSVLSVCAGDFDSVLSVHSLSKRSNLAGYRAGFVAGDPALVSELLDIRRHSGMMVPGPVQAAMIAALGDEAHLAEQKARYRHRREVLRAALVGAGCTIDHSEAGLYLWATRGMDSWSTVDWLASYGILATPGVFYGPSGDRHVRLALTVADERVAAAAARLAA